MKILFLILAALPVPLQDVGIDQRLDAKVPLELTFRDEAGKQVKLGDYFHDKPVILVPVYYECPMLCTLTLQGLERATRAMALKEYRVVTFSIDPREKAAKRRVAGWHYLTGDEASIRQLTEAIGFRYRWDESTKQFAHAAGVMVLTPEGKIARYFYGVEYSPRDLRLSLVETSAGKIGSPVDAVFLFCFHYDPLTGKYGLAITRLLQVAGVGTVLALGTFIGVMLRRERRA